MRKYQCDNKIVCTGSESTTGYGKVGVKTRNLINSQITTTSATGTQSPANLTSVISDLLKQVAQLQAQLRAVKK